MSNNIDTLSPQAVEATETEETPEMLPMHSEPPYQPLATLYQRFLAWLDRFSGLRSISPPQRSEIKKFAYWFQLWEKDVASRALVRPGSTVEVLQGLDDTRSPVTLQLRDLFQQMLIEMREIDDVSYRGKDSSLLTDELWGQFEEVRGLTHLIPTEYGNKDEAMSELTLGSIVLSFDGGGIKTYSSLLILKDLLEKVRIIQGSETVRPRDYFDYIFGSSSGGLLAVMLGRLKMDIDKCILSFKPNAREILKHPRFSTTRVFGKTNRPKYSIDKVGNAVEKLVTDCGKDEDGRSGTLRRFAATHDHCRTGVVASKTDDSGVATPYLFRTYNVFPTNSFSPLQRNPGRAVLWQIHDVGMASMAAPLYFVPAAGQRHHFLHNYLDGGLSLANNPSVEAYREVEAVYRQRFQKVESTSAARAVSLFISIGSGIDASTKKPQSTSTGLSQDPRSIFRSMAATLTDTERPAQEMRFIAREQGFPYFRFNVDRDVGELPLDEWKYYTDKFGNETVDRIESATQRYLDKKDTQAELDKCARLLVSLWHVRL